MTSRTATQPPSFPSIAKVVLGGALVATALWLSACGRDDSGRVLVIGLDGMDPHTIDLLLAEGQLPNFARLRQEGAYGRVECPPPLLSPILWTTIATGKSAADHGIGHFVAKDASGQELPVTSQMRRVKAVWNMAAEAGRKPAVIGWWATWPPEDVGDGLIISDHTAYHFLFGDGVDGGAEEGKTHPPELLERIQPLLQRPSDLSVEDLQGFVDVPAAELSKPVNSLDDDLDHFRWALATAKSYRDIGLELWQSERPDLQMVYIEGTDSTSHLFGHLFRAEDLAGELLEQQQRYGRTVEEMYRFADDLLGRYLDAVDDDTTVIVVSDHGFELGALHDDPTRTRDLRRVSERFHRDQGILYLWGRNVRPGARLETPHLQDLAPTMLALLDLPIGRDMPGRALMEALVDPPEPQLIASWETTGKDTRISGARDAETDEMIMEHLRGLGYLSSSEATQSGGGDRNLAAINFQNGRYREAGEIYRRLIDENPEDAGLRTSFAGVLGALERYDAAMEQLTQALEIDPVNVEAYHNRAVILERQGNAQAAVDDYSRAVRYRPQYEPSRRALERLVGTANVHGPSDEAQQRAAELAEQASLTARRGDYPSALALLDEAATIAPDYGLVYQYRSNVAYLMGDLDLAIQALEKGIEVEPDNQLFRQNLERLQQATQKVNQQERRWQTAEDRDDE